MRSPMAAVVIFVRRKQVDLLVLVATFDINIASRERNDDGVAATAFATPRPLLFVLPPDIVRDRRGAGRSPDGVRCASHSFRNFDAEQVEAALQDARRNFAEGQPRAAGGFFRLEDGAGFVERGEAARELVEIVAQEIGAVFVRNGFEGEAEVQEEEGGELIPPQRSA